ncbi:MAG: bifunctional serine/threonine-protein kinase/universal stress protein [Burkholderiales bacterium]
MARRIPDGTDLAGFRIESLLHEGGNGYVYQASPPAGRDPGFPVVVKVPGLGVGESSLGLVSFEIEQMIHPALTGPHVPRVVAAGVAGPLPYIAMERIDGEPLAAIVARAPLPPAEVARVGAALADALHSVHRQDVIHHDVKPENFLLRPDGTAVLLDFGYAHHTHYPDLLAEESHHAAGSAGYVSPEQLQGIRGDPRSDVFALGVLLYALATGELPFGEPDTLAGMRDRLWREPAPPRSLVPDLPAWLQEIVLRALDLDTARRYATAAHVAFDLRHPDQVAATDRGQRTQGRGFMAQARNWWRARHRDDLMPPPRTQDQAPVVMVAVDTEHPDDVRHAALQSTTRRIVSVSADFRLMFVSVVPAAPLGEGVRLEDTASGRQLEHRNRLRHWIEPLRLPPHRYSLHVIESADPAETLLDLARTNNVDLIVIGAPGPSTLSLAWWRSVASTVTANAACSVHVVRVPEKPAGREVDSLPQPPMPGV